MGIHSNRCAPGFTLVEVLVALAITGALLLCGRLLLQQLADSDDRLASETARRDAAANTDAVLRRLVLQADQPSIVHPFTGEPHTTRFTSWCDMPAGWEESCTVTLTLRATLTVSAPPGSSFVARREMAGAEFRYLRNAADGGRWQRAWRSNVTIPLAIGIVTPTDTTILRIGERG